MIERVGWTEAMVSLPAQAGASAEWMSLLVGFALSMLFVLALAACMAWLTARLLDGP